MLSGVFASDGGGSRLFFLRLSASRASMSKPRLPYTSGALVSGYRPAFPRIRLIASFHVGMRAPLYLALNHDPASSCLISASVKSEIYQCCSEPPCTER